MCTSTLILTGAILVILMLIVVAFVIFSLSSLHQFLAQNKPVNKGVLMVEGWLPDYAIEEAMKVFRNGPYHQFITIGGPIQRGSYLFRYGNFAELAAATLIALGLEKEKILIASSASNSSYRTYNSATELKHWLSISNQRLSSFDFFTLGTHSRRSRVLFEYAFGKEVEIGIIAAVPLHYNPKKWWRSSEGTRTVLSELIAYLYTLIFIVRFSSKHTEKH